MELIAEFKECPVCKIDARLMYAIIQKEIAKGNMNDDVMPNTFAKVVTNIDPRKPPLIGGRVVSVRIFYDMCTNCGKEYPVKIEKGHVTIPSQPGAMPVFA